jgi:hypothetical protein
VVDVGKEPAGVSETMWYLEQDEIGDDGIALPPGMRLDDHGNLVREAPP